MFVLSRRSAFCALFVIMFVMTLAVAITTLIVRRADRISPAVTTSDSGGDKSTAVTNVHRVFLEVKPPVDHRPAVESPHAIHSEEELSDESVSFWTKLCNFVLQLFGVDEKTEAAEKREREVSEVCFDLIGNTEQWYYPVIVDVLMSKHLSIKCKDGQHYEFALDGTDCIVQHRETKDKFKVVSQLRADRPPMFDEDTLESNEEVEKKELLVQLTAQSLSDVKKIRMIFNVATIKDTETTIGDDGKQVTVSTTIYNFLHLRHAGV
eukprot:GHVS01071967.1.p1 GENE.GHVS01071967.1~~GHVS01071967.1.p1  ORF type:complete len:307 (-),score=60.58 GHVS01071967.1:138-932(-)